MSRFHLAVKAPAALQYVMSENPSMPPPDTLLLLISIECFFEKSGVPYPQFGGEWEGFVCALPENWDGLIDARGQAQLPRGARWADSPIAALALALDQPTPAERATPVFVAAAEIGVMYWPVEVVAESPPGQGQLGVSETHSEAIKKRMAAIMGAVMEAGECKSPISLGRFPGGARPDWQVVAPAAIKQWRSLNEERSMVSELVQAAAAPTRRAL